MEQLREEWQTVRILSLDNGSEVESDNTANSMALESVPGVSGDSQTVAQQPELWSCLPVQCHPVIGGMLEISPVGRFTIQMVLQDAWVQQIPYCYLGESGNPVISGQHEHHLWR